MDMSEVEGIDMIEEQNHPTNHWWGEEDMNMVGSHMLEIEDMDTVEEHYHPINHWPEVEGMNTVEEHYHPINHWSEVEGMDMEDSGMREDMTVEVEVVKREPDGVVLARHWTGDGATRHQRAGWEWEELTKSGCSEVQPIFTNRDSNYCSSWRRG
jgi:hypothetical protein